MTRRCVADKLNTDRARTILVEAAEQCARTALPELAVPLKLDALLKQWPDNRTLFFADENGGDPAAAAFAACSALANSAYITSGVIFGFTRVSSLALGAAGASGFGVTTVASVSRVLGMAVVT